MLLNDFFIPSLRNTDLELVARQIEPVHSDIFGSKSWSQTMLKKVNFIIEVIQENLGHIFVVSDIDIQFFRDISQNLISHLKDRDIVFQADDYF